MDQFRRGAASTGIRADGACSTGPFHAVLLMALAAAALPPTVAEAQIRTGAAIEVTSTGPNPGSPAVAMQDHGGFVVAWENRESFGRGDEGVRFQRFDADGARLGEAVALSERGVGLNHRYLRGPAVAADGAGGFVVAWEDGSDYRVRVRRFSSGGVALGRARRVDAAEIEQCQPAIAIGRDGGFAVAWMRRDWASGQIVMRRYDPMGAPVGEAQSVDEAPDGPTGHRVHDPKVAIAADGRITIVWSHPDGYVGIRRYDANGVSEGPAQAASSSAFSVDPPRAAIALAPDGRFVVAWTPSFGYGAAFNSSPGVWVRAFDAAGNALGDEYRIHGNSWQVDSVDVASAPDGGFVVTWIANTPDGSAVLGQRLDANGLRLSGGVSTIVAARTAQHQAMAMGVAGDFVVVAGAQSYGYAPVAQRLRIGELPVLSLGHRRVTITEGEIVRIPARLDDAAGVPFWVTFTENTTGLERVHRRHFSESATQRRLFEFSPPPDTRPQPTRHYAIQLFPPSSGVAAVAPDAGTARVTVLDDD